ncbi:helix-turn-helix domain-containing protein [Streptomyces herbicida]|uniref:helix-turn-helix domain-containing protein n=1 Tax=Streptomyces herbicida TaxID=3065675 RepID=UPI0029316629|nr:helix-turn-helix transcriptional regulator [Streptomyces sp. NEAU-HV9]
MPEPFDFSASLARLLDHRELDVQELADRAGLSADRVRAVLEGEAPGEELLRRLAAALGLHAVDLFILAGVTVPDDMAPLDASAERWVSRVVRDAVHVSAAGRRELLQFIRSLPQEERCSVFAPKRLALLVDGPGDRVIRMLRYRNLNWMGMAETLAFTTPTYLSAATYGVIGSGRKEPAPSLVTDFAAVLGIDALELAALTGVFLPEMPASPTPRAVDAAALLWETPRLSAAQARHVSELARSMRGDSHRCLIHRPES